MINSEKISWNQLWDNKEQDVNHKVFLRVKINDSQLKREITKKCFVMSWNDHQICEDTMTASLLRPQTRPFCASSWKRGRTHARAETPLYDGFYSHGLTSSAAFAEVSCKTRIIRSVFPLSKKRLLTRRDYGNHFKQRFRVINVQMLFFNEKSCQEQPLPLLFSHSDRYM